VVDCLGIEMSKMFYNQLSVKKNFAGYYPQKKFVFVG